MCAQSYRAGSGGGAGSIWSHAVCNWWAEICAFGGLYDGGYFLQSGFPIAHEADIAISPVVGPEALTGSTRLKSGTAQKLVLNMISTGAMVKFGKVYQNLMVDMQATNVKLVDRACRMVVEATGIAREQAQALLKQTDFDVKPAILMALTGLDAAAAREKLAAHQGFLRAALEH